VPGYDVVRTAPGSRAGSAARSIGLMLAVGFLFFAAEPGEKYLRATGIFMNALDTDLRGIGLSCRS